MVSNIITSYVYIRKTYQNQNSLLVKRQTDNTTPGGGMGLDRRGLVPSSHKRSKFRHTII